MHCQDMYYWSHRILTWKVKIAGLLTLLTECKPASVFLQLGGYYPQVIWDIEVTWVPSMRTKSSRLSFSPIAASGVFTAASYFPPSAKYDIPRMLRRLKLTAHHKCFVEPRLLEYVEFSPSAVGPVLWAEACGGSFWSESWSLRTDTPANNVHHYPPRTICPVHQVSCNLARWIDDSPGTQSPRRLLPGSTARKSAFSTSKKGCMLPEVGSSLSPLSCAPEPEGDRLDMLVKIIQI
jgi:hypothetical protein